MPEYLNLVLADLMYKSIFYKGEIRLSYSKVIFYNDSGNTVKLTEEIAYYKNIKEKIFYYKRELQKYQLIKKEIDFYKKQEEEFNNKKTNDSKLKKTKKKTLF